MWLPYRIVNDGSVKLAAASALTANFPPVFSNARVRLVTRAKVKCDAQSYFVTDGGATENLGLVSALFALRGTLSQLPPDTTLSDIHVLALEASAIDYDYHDDRGVGAATGGSKERINAGLTQSLLKEVGALVAPHGAALRVHYLPLPVAFRSRGGFGTHWMFARNVRVTNPLLTSAPDWKQSLLGLAGDERAQDHVDLSRGEVLAGVARAVRSPRAGLQTRRARHQGPEVRAARLERRRAAGVALDLRARRSAQPAAAAARLPGGSLGWSDQGSSAACREAAVRRNQRAEAVAVSMGMTPSSVGTSTSLKNRRV